MTKEDKNKKPVARKTVPQKAKVAKDSEKKPVKDDVETTVPEVKEEPKRKKKIEIDRDEMIACRSTTGGKLIYVSSRSKDKYVWRDYGSVEYIEMGELLTMKSSQPTFLENVRFVVDDDEAATFLGLDRIYENMIQLDDINNLFNKNATDLGEILSKLPAGLKATVASKAREALENGSLDSRSVIKVIEDKLDVSLQVFDA